MLDFDKLYKENKAMVLRYLVNKTKNRSDSEELVNDIFIKVFKHLNDYDETKSAFSTWLINITKNSLIDYYRLKGGSNKAKAFANMINTDSSMTNEVYQVFQVPDNGIKTDSLYDSHIINENTARQINALNGKYKEIAIDYFYNDLSYDEIQVKHELSLGTVKIRINRLRKQLQENLKNELQLV